MAMQTFEVFVVVGTGSYNHGQIYIQDYEPIESSSDHIIGRRLISKAVVEVDVPKFDIVALEVEGLEKAVQLEKADSQVRVNLLLDRISKLKAIGHDVN